MDKNLRRKCRNEQEKAVFMNKVNTRRKAVSAAVLGKRSWVRMMGLGITNVGFYRLTPANPVCSP